MKSEIWRDYPVDASPCAFFETMTMVAYLLPVGNKVELVERLLERGVLHDETRAITRNRQPGRCCDSGCTKSGQAVMVPIPSTRPDGV